MFLPDSTRSIRGRMPSSLEMARDSSNGDIAAAGLVPLLQRAGVAGAGPVQFEPVARPLAEGQASLEVGHDLA